jgi:hypothetical protein
MTNQIIPAAPGTRVVDVDELIRHPDFGKAKEKPLIMALSKPVLAWNLVETESGFDSRAVTLAGRTIGGEFCAVINPDGSVDYNDEHYPDAQIFVRGLQLFLDWRKTQKSKRKAPLKVAA